MKHDRVSTRRSFLQFILAMIAAATGGRPRAAANDGTRVAMVIGNNAYRTSPPLSNAANDARAMADVLSRAGFEVMRHIDAPAASMAEAVQGFGEAIRRPQVKLALFYYAGHGAEIDWHNYLLPIDVKVDTASDLKSAGFDIARVLSVLPKVRDRSFVIVLDACRDNPFGPSFSPERKGLSPFDAPVGSLIAFSTSPGNVASDGMGANGLYTENLVRELAVPGLRIEDAFKRVRANVSIASRGAQIPWESTSLVEDVFVYPQAPMSEDQLERRYEEEIEHYSRVKGSKNPADWAALLRAFPNGRLSEIAQSRLNALLAASRTKEPARQLAVKPARIELGRGKPVPAYFSRTGNPFSAGSYAIDRQFRVGDFARYRGYDVKEDAQQRQFRRFVTRVDEEGDRVELNDGKFVTDLFGNPVREGKVEYRVPFQVIPAELQVGRRWTARNATVRRGREFTDDMEFEIVAREKISVPAGEFDAFRIEAHTSGSKDRAPGARARRRRTHEQEMREETLVVWEVPGLNFPVKQRRSIAHRDGTDQLQDFELIGLEQGDPGAAK